MFLFLLAALLFFALRLLGEITSTSEVFSEIIEDARSLLLSINAPTDDETLFNMFQVVILSYAYSASDQPAMRKFIEDKKNP